MKIYWLLAVVAFAISSGCTFVPTRTALEPLAPHSVRPSLSPATKYASQSEPADRFTYAAVVEIFPVQMDTPLEKGPAEVKHDEIALASQLRIATSPPVDIWDRMRRGFAMPRLESPAAEQFARHFAAIGFLRKSEPRARRYLYYFLEEIQRRGLPTELALLPLVESGMNPNARSPVGAMGAWQFMPATGRRFDMRVSHLVDDRKSLGESTRGAMEYLTNLYTQFGDWHLALASYNWGEQNVSRAQFRNRTLALPDNYLSLSVPRETRAYVPQLEGLKRVILDPDRYGVSLPSIPNQPYFREVEIRRDMDVDLILRFSRISEAEFFALNASVKRPLLIAAATPTILLPPAGAEHFETHLAAHSGPLAHWTAIRLSDSQRVEALATRYGITARQLREINGIPPGMKPSAGSSVIVPRRGIADDRVPDGLVNTAYLTISPDLVRTTMNARKGEMLSAMAKRLGLKPTDIVRWNPGLSLRTRIKKGQKVTVYVRDDFPGTQGARKRQRILGSD
jgi:membrane-bound lytic murein transglycosylase D